MGLEKFLLSIPDHCQIIFKIEKVDHMTFCTNNPEKVIIDKM
jgi:hypothetical protein